MKIEDLNYLENLPAASSISGSALAAVIANASATGDPTYTWTDTTTRARELRNGGSIAFGRGWAVAIGEDPSANVDVYGEGDKVIERTQTLYLKRFNAVVSRGVVIAIDHP